MLGVDIEPQPEYPGMFLPMDVLEMARRLRAAGGPPISDQTRMAICAARNARLVVASPPCEEFTRHMLPWTKRKNPPPPDLALIEACVQIADTLAVPLVLENVREAQRYIGRARWHCGAFYLWGAVPVLMPQAMYRKKESYTSGARLERAMVPLEVGRWIGDYWHPRRDISSMRVLP